MSKEHYFTMFVHECDPAVCIVSRQHWDKHKSLSDDLPSDIYEYMAQKHCVTLDDGIFLLPENSKAIVAELRERFIENNDLKTYLNKIDTGDTDWVSDYDDVEIDYDESYDEDDDLI